MLLNGLLGNEANATLPALGSLIDKVVDAELVLVLLGELVKLLLRRMSLTLTLA